MRTVINKMFRKQSVFEGLRKHSVHVKEGSEKMKEAIMAYLQEDYEKFNDITLEVMKIEKKADWVKSNIRNHIPKGIFLPVDRMDFLGTLKEQDAVLDSCEDAVIWLSFKKIKIDENIKKEILEYLDKTIEVVERLVSIVENIHRLISAISRRERKVIKKELKTLHFEEEETDTMERALLKEVFNSGKDMQYIYHVTHLIFILGRVADHSESVSNGLRMMMAR